MIKIKLLKNSRRSIVLTIVFSAISALSVSVIPFIPENESVMGSVMGYVFAAVFWFALLMAFVASGFTRKTLYKYRRYLVSKKYIPKEHPWGIFSFSKKWNMLILYGTCLAGIAVIVTDIVFCYVPERIMFPIISLTMLLFAVHCVVDGKYYKVYKQIKESVNNEKGR